MKKNKITVIFRISSHIMGVEELIKCTGLTFNRNWHVGDKRVTGEKDGKPIFSEAMVHVDNGGTVELCSDEELDVEAMTGKLLKILNPHSAAIKNILDKCIISFECVIYWHDPEAPPLHFGKEIVEALSAIGAELDIDLYMMG